MEDCIFCKIINGEIPCKKVYEDEDVLAFNDINPKARVHVLVIPKKHINSLKEVSNQDKDLIFKMHETMNKVATIMGVDSYRMVVNCGKEAGQEVMHLHFHLLAN